jgi:hypothetical protein
MGPRTSTTSEAAPKQLFEEIRLGTLGAIKERVESSSPEPTAEGVSAKRIGIKSGLLRCRSVLVVRGALLVVLEDLSLRMHIIESGQAGGINSRYTYFVRFLYLLKFFPCIFVWICIRMKFTSELSGVSETFYA